MNYAMLDLEGFDTRGEPVEDWVVEKPPIMACLCLEDHMFSNLAAEIVMAALSLTVRRHDGKHYVRGHEFVRVNAHIHACIQQWQQDVEERRRAWERAQPERQAAERQSRVEPEPFVYFVQAGPDGPIKIGVAKNVKKRLSSLQVSSSQKLSLLATTCGGYDRERELHDKFAPHRTVGEWFRPEPDLLEFIATIGSGNQ